MAEDVLPLRDLCLGVSQKGGSGKIIPVLQSSALDDEEKSSGLRDGASSPHTPHAQLLFPRPSETPPQRPVPAGLGCSSPNMKCPFEVNLKEAS